MVFNNNSDFLAYLEENKNDTYKSIIRLLEKVQHNHSDILDNLRLSYNFANKLS